MKKLLFALIIMPLCSFGQISLRPHIGAGYGMASQHGILVKANTERAGVFIQNAGLSAVYSFNDWFMSAGVGYLTTGYGYDWGTVYSSTISLGGVPIEPPTILFTNAKWVYKYQHLTIPITVGRKFSLKKFSLLPEAGIDLAYNFSEKARLTSDQDPNPDYYKHSDFSSEFHRLSVFANMSVAASYSLTDRLSVFCGPTYKYMVTDIVKQKKNYLTGASISQHHHAMLFNAGVYIRLPQSKAGEPVN